MTLGTEAQSTLGLCFDHSEAGAAILVDGTVLAAMAEERASRIRGDSSFPLAAARWCLAQASLDAREIHSVVVCGVPLRRFERVLSMAPTATSRIAHIRNVLRWWAITGRLHARSRTAAALGIPIGRISTTPSEDARAAAAFLSSEYERATVVSLEVSGDDSGGGVWLGEGERLRRLVTTPMAGLGQFRAAVAAYLGLQPTDPEDGLAALARDGQPRYAAELAEWFDRSNHIPQLRRPTLAADGQGRVSNAIAARFGPEGRAADVAASARAVIQESLIGLARYAVELTGQNAICLGGLAALDSTAVSRIREELALAVFAPPVGLGVAGAIGAAALRQRRSRTAALSNLALGRSVTDADIEGALALTFTTNFARLPDAGATDDAVSRALGDGSVVGVVRGSASISWQDVASRAILVAGEEADARRRLARIRGDDSFALVQVRPGVFATPFAVRAEPPVDTALDALRAFEWSDIEVLALGNYIVRKVRMAG